MLRWEVPYVTQGEYVANNSEVNLEFDNIKVVPYNKYRMVITFKYEGVKVGCTILYLDMVPKKL